VRARLALILALLPASCGKVVGDLPSDGNPGAADARLGDAGSPFPQGSIRRLRAMPPPLNMQVTLNNLVVVGRVTGRLRAEIYVQDMGVSGPNSSLRLICTYPPNCNLRGDQVDDLPIGAVLTTVTGRYDLSESFDTDGDLRVPQLTQLVIAAGTSTVAPVAETVTVDMLARGNASNPAVLPRLTTYVRVQAPIMITNVTPSLYEDTCDVPPDAGPAGMLYRGTEALSGATQLLLQLGGVTSYCRSQCNQTCATEVTVGDNLSGVAGVLLVAPSTMPDLFIRPSQNSDVPDPN